MSPQYGVLISTGFASWQSYCTGSSSGCQATFAALNRGRHLYSAGRPLHWALAHILVCFFVFFCTVRDFTAVEKDRGVQFCMRVRLLSGQVFSHFGELWLMASHDGGITFGM